MTYVSRQLIVFTDLDGTLLDHETYTFDPALSAIERLKSSSIPVVLTTSKTWAEVKELQEELGLNDPCIVENGSAIYLGDSGFSKSLDHPSPIILGHEYSKICSFIGRLPKKLRSSLVGFADMSAQQVAAETGLPIEKAHKAKQRDASEPFLWNGEKSDFEILRKTVESCDLRILQGGRFYHLLGDVDKRNAMQWMMYQAAYRLSHLEWISCALGDGPNDVDMLQGADFGIVIANPHGQSPIIKKTGQRIIYSKSIGPTGWAEEMHRLLDEMGL